jgi:hypothetical protein
MKKYLSILLVALLISTTISAQAIQHDIITSMRMGIFKLKSTVVEIEKLTGQKLKIKFIKDNYVDTVTVVYKNASYILGFVKIYDGEGKNVNNVGLYTISSSNTLLKTKSNMGLKSTKAMLLAAYDKNDLEITNYSDFKDKNIAKDKIQNVTLNDFEAASLIVFQTEDRIVKSIEVRIYEGE